MERQLPVVCGKVQAVGAGCRPRIRFRPRSVVVILALLAGISASGPAPPDFTGHGSQAAGSGAQCHLDIEQNGLTLQVKTTATTAKGSRHLEVSYRIGGPETVYKGLEGDEFHSSADRNGNALVFDTVEHEGGRKLPETTVWTLAEDRNSLQVKRRSTKSAGKGESFTTYVRQP